MVDEIKILFLGECDTGKTTLIKKLIGGEFNENEPPSNNASYKSKKILINNKNYTLNLWDTTGKNPFRVITKMFYQDSKIVIFVYDMTHIDSFEELNYWIKSVEENLGQDVIKAIIANKSDLFNGADIHDEKGLSLANEYGAKFFVYSAKNDSKKKLEEFIVELLKEYLKK